jgi:hypothetical protein
MNRAEAGGELRVMQSEEFVIERRVLPGGALTSVNVPPGVVHTGTRKPALSRQFGQRLRVEEHFKCDRPGRYEIRFESGRPWEAEKTAVVTTVVCR